MQASDIPFHLKQINWAIVWYSGVQGIGCQASKDSDPCEMGSKWSESCNCPGSLPVRIVGRRNPDWAQQSEWKRWSWEFEGGQVAWCSPGRVPESCTGRWLWRSAGDILYAFSWVPISAWETTQDPGKKSPKRGRRSIHWSSQGWE